VCLPPPPPPAVLLLERLVAVGEEAVELSPSAAATPAYLPLAAVSARCGGEREGAARREKELEGGEREGTRGSHNLFMCQ